MHKLTELKELSIQSEAGMASAVEMAEDAYLNSSNFHSSGISKYHTLKVANLEKLVLEVIKLTESKYTLATWPNGEAVMNQTASNISWVKPEKLQEQDLIQVRANAEAEYKKSCNAKRDELRAELEKVEQEEAELLRVHAEILEKQKLVAAIKNDLKAL